MILPPLTTLLALATLSVPGATPPPGAAVQDAESSIRALADERAGLERRRLFLDAWRDAAPADRESAARVLRLARDGAERLAATPSVRALTRAWRTLRAPGEPLESTPLQRFVDAVSLRVVPGLYAGRPEGRPEALTVRLSQLYPPDAGELATADEFIEVSLIWLAPDGSEVRGRTEPVAPFAFGGVGFPMYLRAPSAVPGAWSLVCEIRRGDEARRGVPVPVLGLDEPDALLEELDGDTREQFRLLRESGVRPTFFREFQERAGVRPFDAPEAWLGARPVALEHAAFAELRAAGHACWSLGTDSVESPRAILLLLRPEDEVPAAAVVGALGEAWKREVDENDWWVLSSDLQLLADDGPSLARLAEELAAWKPEAELVLVGRGDALLELQLAQLRRPEWPFDRIVLSTVLSASAQPRNLPALPGLLVTSDEREAGSEELELEGRPAWRRELRTEPLVVTDLALPGRIARWLSAGKDDTPSSD